MSRDHDINATDQRKCFFVTPIGNVETSVRKNCDSLLQILGDILRPFNTQISAAHTIRATRSITDDVLKGLLEADLVIANLTGANPNVYYEIGIRHATGLPLIAIAEEGTQLPFDISSLRTVFFEDKSNCAAKLSSDLTPYIKSAFDTVTRSGHACELMLLLRNEWVSRLVKSEPELLEAILRDMHLFTINVLKPIDENGELIGEKRLQKMLERKEGPTTPVRELVYHRELATTTLRCRSRKPPDGKVVEEWVTQALASAKIKHSGVWVYLEKPLTLSKADCA